MNFLDYLVNAMTGGQPTQQELMARQMAKQGLLGDPNSVLRESEMRMTPQMAGRQLPPAVQMPQYTNPAGQMKPAPMPQIELQPGTLPPSRMPSLSPSQMSPYMQNLTNPGMTMQQNYIDPRLIEQMYYRGLLSR
jgi:hypothetical protein